MCVQESFAKGKIDVSEVSIRVPEDQLDPARKFVFELHTCKKGNKVYLLCAEKVEEMFRYGVDLLFSV